MAESVTAPATASVKASKKKSAVRTKKVGPSLTELILNAVSESKGRKGLSLYAIKKILADKGYIVDNRSRIKTAVLALVTKGSLVRVTGVGASGSFRIAQKPKAKKAPTKKVVPKVRKPVAKKLSKVSTKKPRKVATKKTKKVAAKSPLKKSTKAAKKPRKSPIKKTAARKPIKAAKKTKQVKKVTQKKPKTKKTVQKRK